MHGNQKENTHKITGRILDIRLLENRRKTRYYKDSENSSLHRFASEPSES